VDELVVAARSGWEVPVRLDAVGELPAFPTDPLPDWLCRTVEEVAGETQTPTDMAALFGIGALSTVCGGKAVVRVRGGWVEPVNTYGAVVMPPGELKSAAQREMHAPIVEREQRLAMEAKPMIAAAQAKRRIAEHRAEAAQNRASAAKTAERNRLELEAVETAQELAEIHVPQSPRLFSVDATPERIASLLHEHGGRRRSCRLRAAASSI
jgi:hypothetical protein